MYVLEHGIRIVRTTIKYPDLRRNVSVHSFGSMDEPDIVVLSVLENCSHYQSRNSFLLTNEWTIPDTYGCEDEYLDDLHPILKQMKQMNDNT